MRGKILLLIPVALFFLFAGVSWAASPSKAMREGIKAYKAGKYDKALKHFEDAEVVAPDNLKVRFDASSARYHTKDYKDSAKGFAGVASKTDDRTLKEKAFYNLGNVAYRNKDLKGSSDFYRKALALNPGDREAKENLEFVLKELEKEKKQSKQQQKSSSNKQGKPSPTAKKEKSKQQQQQTEQPRGKTAQQPKTEQQEQSHQKGEKKGPPAPSAAQKEKEKKRPEGEIKEAGGKEKKNNGEEQPLSRSSHPVQTSPLTPEEAKRLLNSLSDDQRAYFKKQAAQEAPEKKDVPEDW
jgi:Ca-activated chloride channel family protein